MNIRNIVSDCQVGERMRIYIDAFEHRKFSRRFAIESQNVLMQSTLLPLT